MRLFNRLVGGLQNSGANKENNHSRGRNDEGTSRAKSDKQRNLSTKKLGLEALEERQLLSVNPVSVSEYDDIRQAYANLELPASMSQINVIAVDDLSAAALQAAVDQAAQTESDDLILLRTTADNYVVNLESTAVTVNIDSEQYGKLTIVGKGEQALTIETVNSNAFTVLNGDFTMDGAVIFNYSTDRFTGEMIFGSPDAKITQGETLVIVSQVAKSDPVTGDVSTTYLVDRAATPEEMAAAGVLNTTSTPISPYRRLDNPSTGGDDYNQVRNAVHAVLRHQIDYFGYTPVRRFAPDVGPAHGVIYDAECVGNAGWVGTIANMMAYTGWAQQAGFSTSMTLSDGSVKNYASVEDAVVDYLRNEFISTNPVTATGYSITAASILDYLFAGNDEDCFGRNYSALTNTVEGGALFPEIDFGKVGGYVPASDSMLQDMLRALRDRHAITMEVETVNSWGGVQREYLSVWGYVHNSNLYTFEGGSTNGSAPTVGLICTNPTKGSYEQPVRDSRYNNTENYAQTLTHYVDVDSAEGDNYNTYHTYLLSGSGTNLQLVHAPFTYLDDNGNVQGAINFPEGFNFYKPDNSASVTYTTRIVGFTWLSQYTDKMPVCEINQSTVLALESIPGKTDNVLYLHFGGAGTGWDGLTHPELNLDGVAGYGVSELKMIEEVWRRVSEDYAPFNVNVTTNANVWNAAAKGVRCVIGGYNPSAGGLSYVGVYGPSKQDNYVYPFSLNLNAKSIAEAASHEIGHTFGLGHDGYEHNEYYTGENSAGWAPIMGAGYHQPITQWSNGDYVNATNFQDDVAIIASYVGFRPDQHGDSAGNATDLGDYYINVNLDEYNPYAGTYRVESVIETREDIDVFSFTSYGGTYVVDVSGDGADHRFIDNDFAWTYRRNADVENPVFAGKYYAKSYDYTNLNLRVSMLDEFGQPLLLDLAGAILKLGYGERTRAFYSDAAHDSNYHFYVVDQFGAPVYLDDAKTILKEGYYAVDDSVFTTFSHFVTPELEAGKTYYIKVEGVGQGSSTTNGYSDYGSLGQYTLVMHESYENFRIDDIQMDVTDLSFSTAVDNVLNWKEAFVYSGRRLEDGSSFLGNTLRINESLANTTITLNDALTFSYSRGIVKQPWAAKRFVLDATPAWDTENNQPGVTLDAQEKFRTLYVDNTTLEIYGFIITNGVASRGTSASQVNNGGGVYNHNGWLTIGDSIISGNRALKAGGGIYNAGGEYENTSQHDGWLYLINTSVVGNIVTEDGAVGGGIFNESGGVLTMVNTTVAGNTAGYSGGGIQNFGIINAYNSIIAKNYAAYGADVYTIYQQGTTNVRATIIGDESRNARLEAYRNGVNSIGDARSYIGNSVDGTIGSPRTIYDPEFISYRDYSMGDWSAELWKFWNLRLVGDSLAVNLGVNGNLSTSLDFSHYRVQAGRYGLMGNTRYYVGASDITEDLAGQNRIEDSVVDAGAYEVLAQPDLTQFVPTSAGSDVVNNWENSIVVSRAIDDQTGSVAPFLVNEPLYLNLGVINQGAAITSDFDITVYMWKYDPYTSKADMYANSVQGTGLPIMNVKVEFPAGAAMPGGTVDAVVTCTNLALGTTNTFTYDGLASYLLLENVAMGSVEEIVAAMIANGQMAPQNEEGYFVFGYAIDSNDAIAEYRETNNFFRTSSYFDVVESPVSINDSIVVTTTDDVVDPYDGEISLREAVEIYAGSFYYAEIALQDGDVFQANGVTYNVVNGKFYVDNTVPYQVYPGEQFTLADSSVITYVVDVFYNDADQAVNVPDGTVATVNGLECTLSAGVWTNVEETARYTRDDVQAQGSFTMANGDVVTVVNGVFRREMTHDVAIVPDGSVVTLATGEIAVYDFAQDRFVVTETTSFVLGDGDTIIVGGETLTLVADSYLDAANTRYYLLPGTQVTLSNGFPVTYDGTNFVYNTAAVSSTKLAAGTTVLLNGEEYSYKAGRALVKRVSRESNTVVFDPSLAGATFDLTQGPLTLDKSFTLDCVDWNGNQLDLTITSQSANPCLFLMLESADVTIMNFKFEGATSDEEGSILENYGKLTVSNVTFRDNVAEQGNLIFNASGATLNVEGSTFENNEAQLSALIYNLGSANINGGATFTGDYGFLSPVYSKGILTVEETVFTSTSGENGGAIHNDGGTVVIARSEFKTTSADNHGGAIYNVGDADLSVYDTTFDGTISTLDGGAIFNGEGAKLVTEASIFKNIDITGVGGAIFNAGAFEDKDSLFENNSANAGAAIYTLGSVSLDGSTFKTNSAQEGGAIYAGTDSNLQIIGGSFFSNAATNGAAIYASGELYASNSLFAKNTATNLGGAIYAASTTTFVNVTIADNKAADGAGFYNAGTATFDNSIIAGNTATGSGYDLYTEEGATSTLRSSLLGNIAQYGPKSFDTVAAYRSLLGVNPEFNADYTLKGTSPAINAGSNDLENAEFDLAGNARRVGLVIGGAVRTVDMGAFEYQTIIAPDLAIVASSVDYWGAEVIINNVTTELGYFIAGKDVSINFNVQNIGDARVIDNFGFNVKLVGVDSNGNTVYDQTLPTQYYATDFINHNWLNVADWIAVNGEATMMTNFGSLPAGFYTVTVTLDVEGVGAIYEYGEDDGYVGVNNNVFEGSFNVFSEPSTVVTTENDVIDPVDGETSLREAIEAAGDYQYVSTYLVADGTTFTLENGEVLTVVDGWLTQKVDVVVKNGVPIDLVEGDEFLLNGRPIYYHYQMNGGYFTYGVGADSERVPQSALSSGEITYPDGTSASFQLQTSQYIHFVEDSDLNPQEGTHYTYNVLKTPDGDVVLTNGMEFEYSNVKFTYYQNETYPKGAFVFEDGNVVEYVDGANLQFASLAIGSLSTRNARVEKSVQLADGSTLEVKNGVAKIFKEINANVTFHKTKMQNKTIVVDPAQGPVVIDKTTVLPGSDIVIERELAILGEDRNVTVSGNDVVNMFLINADTVASISDLTMTKGYAKVGGALINRGDLNLNNIKFVDNEAYWIKSASSGEHLVEGLGGAIANYGFLTVDGGSFTGNHATDFGGAIFANTAGETVVKNAAFSNNTAFAGGAIANQSGGLTVENTTFSSNSAERAGAIYTLDDLTVVASVFTGNKAIAEDFASRNVVGGAIYASKDATLTFAADPDSESTVAVTFDGNVAESGGAVYAETGFQVTGDLVATNNVANASQYVSEVKGDYGAIYADGAVDVSGNLTMTGNTADGSYGAFFAGGVSVGGDAVLSNNAAGESYGAGHSYGAMNIGGSLTANNNSAGDFFGALNIDGVLTVGGNAEISNNTAEKVSGVRADGVAITGDLTLNNNASTINTGALVSDVSIKVDGSVTAHNNAGGALAAQNDVTIGGDASLENNASQYGGAIHALGAVLVNGSVTARGNVAEVAGGAIYADSFETKGALVATGNQARHSGGAVCSSTYVKIGAGNSNISGNQAYFFGGAIFAIDSVAIAGDAVVATNVAASDQPSMVETTTDVTTGPEGETIKTTVVRSTYSALGGAIYVAAGGAEFGGDVLFNRNKATGSAGALYAKGGVKVAGDATFTNNSAEGYTLVETTTEITPASGEEPTTTTTTTTEYVGDYGAAYIFGALEIEGVFELADNTAGRNYGGMYVAGNVVVNGDVDKTYDDEGNEIPYTGFIVKISGNKAGNDFGALAADGSLTSAGKTEITNNEAGNDYGAVKAASVAIAGDATISGNKAGNDFGALFTDGALTVAGNAEIANNEAGNDYGAVKTASVAITGDANISGNKAGGDFGAVDSAGAVTIGGSATVTNNTAGGNVGAIKAFSVAITGDANISGNKAGGELGAVNSTGAVTIGGSAAITNNAAVGAVGAIYGSSVSITGDANISGNTAGVDFGAIYSAGAVSIGGTAAITNNVAGDSYGAITATSFTVGGSATITGNKATNDVGAIIVTGTGNAFQIVGDAVITGNVAGNVAKVATDETVDVANSTNEAGAPVRTTTTVKTTTTTVYGKYGAFEVANGSAVFGADANISDNTASEFGAFYVAQNFSVAGDLTLERNVANGTETVVTETTTLVEVLDENGEVVSSTTNTETTTATNDVSANYGAGQVGGAFTVTGDAAINANQANDAYGALDVGASMTIGGALTVTNNAAKDGDFGAAHVAGDLEVGGIFELTGNTASGSYGGMQVVGSVSVDGNVEKTYDDEGNEIPYTGLVAKISNNTAGVDVGALIAGGALTIAGKTEIANNEAGNNYGAVRAASVTVTGDANITGNTAGGKVGAVKAGSVSITGDANISGNAAGDSFGAVDSAGAVTIGGSAAVTNNAAGVNTGAISAFSVSIAGDADISGNTAGANFGAISSFGAVTIGGSASVANNTAVGSIGAIYGSSVSITGDANISGNKAGTNVGAIDSEGAVVVGGSAIVTGNVAGVGVGAIDAETFYVGADAEITGNTAGQNVGAIRVTGTGDAFKIVGDAAISGNVAGNVAGVMTAETVSVVNSTNEDGAPVRTTTTVKTTTTTLQGKYGAFEVANGSAVFGGDANISDNTAPEFGTFYVANDLGVAGDLTLERNVANGTETVVTETTTLVEVLDENGEVVSSTTNTETTTATNDVPANYGAGQVGGAFTVTGDAAINANQANGAYGALDVGASMTIGGALTVANNAAKDGDFGAAYVNGDLEVGGIFELTGNTASGSYGGMQVVGSVSVDGNVAKTYDDEGNEIPYTGLVAKISNNTAGVDVGALIAGGALTIAGKTEIANNEAGNNYGAVRAASVTVTGDANITGNTAVGKFGAIFTDSVSITGNVNVADNKAENVGAIFAATVSIGGDANITGNTADVKIGAILAGSVSIGGDANVTGNTANDVGAIAATRALTIGGSAAIANNTARDSYGAILAGSVSIGGDANITGNKAANDVGAIRVTGTGDAFKIVGNAVITGNVVGTTPTVATTETTDVVNSTNEDGAPVRTTTTVKTTTTTLQGKYGAFEVANGSAVFGGDANISDNTAPEFGAFYVAKNFGVAGDLTLERNVANGTETVVTETTTLVEVLDENGEVVSSTTNTETTTATNDVPANYGAGQVGGAFTVTGNAAINANKANDSYGAIHANTVTVSGKATITGNAAVNNAGAIYANSVNLNNALVANNKAGEKAGAIYANTVKLVNVTVAGNTAFEGGALYILGSAVIDNSILAGNSVTTREIVVGEETQTIAGSGVEIFAATGATIKLRNSLLQNAESTGAVAFDSSWMDAAYRCFVNVDPKFVNAAGGDYSLSADSPAINTASNALAVAGVVTDLAGNDRYVGVDIGGVIYSIDMGAYEYQVVISADLAFGENPVNFWYAKVDGQITDHYIVGQDVVLDYSIMNSGDAAVFDKFNVTFTVEGVTATGAQYSKTTVGRYQPGSDFFDWLKNSDWLGVGATQNYARQNLGALPVGEYTITVTLDSGAEIVESISDNNVYTASFAVFEAPSVVVNSAADGDYNPLDDLITLREASEVYVGPYWYGSRVLLESGQYVRDDLIVVTVEDGVATTERNVLVVGGFEVDLADGQAFEYGSTYITFNNNVFTYPDGTQVAYAPGRFQNDYSITLTLADGTTVTAHRESKFDYLESLGQTPPLSTKYEYVDVFEAADGTKTLLSDLQPDSIAYSKTYATYRAYAAQASTGEAVVLANGTKIVYGSVTGVFMNGGFISDDGVYKEVLPDHVGIELVGEEVNTPATYLGPTFTFEDGTFIEFVAGVSVTLESGLVIEMATRRDPVTAEFTTVDGVRYDFANDGSVWISTFVGNEITFSDALIAANAIITLDGAAITPAKDQSIVAATDADGNAVITVDAGTLSRVMSVVFGRVVELANMDFVNGRETTGGAIHNAGTLELTNVSVFNSTAYTEEQVDPDDKILLDGFGGAIYNSGALTVNGGSFSENQAAYFGGAIYSIGALEVDGARFDANASNYFGGAIYFQNSNATITSSIFENNLANYNGGAIAAAATSQASNLTVVNSLLANNSSANAEGGAIYAIGEGAVMTVSLVNDTIADNTAAIGGGVALDNAQAEVKNSIIARNVGSYQGGDLAIQQAATVVLYASLLGDGENVVTPEGLSVADGFSAFVGTTANPVNPRFGADYKLASTSPAVNTGVNSFIEGIEKDVYGGDRIVSEYVDLGAVESSAGAPDLAFDTGDALAGWYSTANGVSTGKFVEGWDVCFDYLFGNYGEGVVLNSFDYTITIDRLDADGNVVEGASKVFTRTYGDNVNGYMSEAFWLEQNETVSGYWNLGLFDAGQYQATIALDVNDTVFESSNDNNAYTTTFEVAERPSLVVTTELDVVDRYDGLVSLREAIAAVGSETTSAISMVKKIEDGATFALAPNAEIGAEEGTIATYANGAITFVIKAEEAGEGEEQQDDTIVALVANVAYALANGETFVWDGADLVTFTSTIADTITFHPTVFGKTIVLVDGELVIDRDMVISVSDGETVTIDAQSASRIFFVAHGDVRIGGLTLVSAKADVGAAIYNAGNLSVTNVAINSAEANSGAGVYNAETATLDLFNVAFADMNAAQDGGAVYNAGSLVGNLVSFNGSTATDGAAIYNTGEATLNQATFRGGQAADQAGAIYNADGTLVVTNSTFDGNTAVYGGAIVNYQGDATITASSFANNEASGGAGAIDNYGALNLTDVVFNSNKTNGFGGAIYNSMSSAANPYVITLSGVEFLANVASKGGAIYNAANSIVVGSDGAVKFGGNVAAEGAAIYNVGAIDASSAWSFEGNSATGSGGALYNAAGSAAFGSVAFISNSAENGAAVYNASTFKATNGNFRSNRASGSGAALYNARGTATISNTVMWLNEAAVNGGAIAVDSGSVTARNVTIAANSAAEMAGGVYNKGTFKAYNAIVASNYAAEAVDLYAATTTTYFYNSLIGSTVGVNKTPTMKNVKTGDAGFSVAPIFAGGKVVNNPDLTLTAGSAAVNAGLNAYALDANGVALVYDLAGNDRICTSIDAVDMGAFEFPFEEPSAIVTTNLDVEDPTDGVVSLREAISYAARLGETTVTFDPSVTNVILNSTLYIDSNVAIGNDAQKLTLESSGFNGSVVVVGSENDAANVTLLNVDIAHGGYGTLSDNPDNAGGGVRNYATLTLDRVGLYNNVAAYGGGAYNAGTMTIIDSEIVGNSANYYGGVYNRGQLFVNRTTIADNSAVYYGGGIGTYTGATVANSLVIANRASLGAGVYAQVNMADLFNSDASYDVNLVNSTIVGNTATGAKSESIGAGVWANHVLNVRNSILYGNNAASADDLYATTIMATSKTTLAYSNVGSANIAITGAGVKSVDPEFIGFDPATEWTKWDLGLQIGSKMINAGHDPYVVGTLDVHGNQRIASGRVDMGAIEEQGNVAPTTINVTLTENILSTIDVGSVVAVLNAVDANEGDTFTYDLLDNAGGAFALDGNNVVVAMPLAAGDYRVTARATDSGGAFVDKTFTIVVTDPAAPNYEAPVVTFVGRDVNSNLVVEWTTTDPAKEYVVEYRVKGDANWTATAALTGTFGLINEAGWQTGDVVEVRIKALASSAKNESAWSDVAEYTIAEAPASFNVEENGVSMNGSYAAVFEVVSNSSAYAYWMVDWNDGTTSTYVGLGMSRVLSHWYQGAGVYNPVLFVDNSAEGFALGTITVTGSGSGATLDLAVEADNVFSTIEPIATDVQVFAAPAFAAAAILDQDAFEWNAISGSVSVKAENSESVALVAEPTVAVAADAFVAETTAAAFAEFGSFEMEVDAAADLDVELSESVFDADFLNDLFEN